MPTISILIPTHNRCGILERTLDSLSFVDVPEDTAVEFLVVANACTDDTVGVAERGIDKLPFAGRVVTEPTPGLSRARNRAIAESSGRIIAFIDDDVQLPTNWLVELEHAFEKRGEEGGVADIVGGRVELWWESPERPDWYQPGMASLLSQNRPANHRTRLTGPYGVVGANFALTREAFDKVGPFREDLGRSGKGAVGGEESDWLQRAQTIGLAVWYEPDLVLKHWVPVARVTPQYLKRVAFGNARGRVRMKPSLGPSLWMRTFLGHSYLLVWHGVRAMMFACVGRSKAAVQPALLRQTGAGGLMGLLDRACGLLGKS